MNGRIASPRVLLRAAAAASAAFALACSDGGVTELDVTPAFDFTGPGDIRAGDGQLEQEGFELCKVGMGATFTVDVINNKTDGTRAVLSYDVFVNDGQCLLVWESGGPGVDTVTVTEQVPAGYVASWQLWQLSGGATTTTSGTGNVASGYVNGLNSGGTPTNAGALAVFTNTPEQTGEGCTPGYWRNHYEDWPPTGYATTDDFDTTFGVNLFSPDITLAEAIWMGGGGLKKIARHGTAALLSAAHPDVDYPITVAEVIAAVQAGDVDMLVTYNELGCDIP